MQSGMVVADATGDVSVVVDRLMQLLDERHVKLFACIDHAAGAREMGMELPDEVLLVFGSASVGTPVMQDDPRAGIELPLRMLVWSENGSTKVGYNDPRRLTESLDLRASHQSLEKMAALLDQLVAGVRDAADSVR